MTGSSAQMLLLLPLLISLQQASAAPTAVPTCTDICKAEFLNELDVNTQTLNKGLGVSSCQSLNLIGQSEELSFPSRLIKGLEILKNNTECLNEMKKEAKNIEKHMAHMSRSLPNIQCLSALIPMPTQTVSQPAVPLRDLFGQLTVLLQRCRSSI